MICFWVDVELAKRIKKRFIFFKEAKEEFVFLFSFQPAELKEELFPINEFKASFSSINSILLFRFSAGWKLAELTEDKLINKWKANGIKIPFVIITVITTHLQQQQAQSVGRELLKDELALQSNSFLEWIWINGHSTSIKRCRQRLYCGWGRKRPYFASFLLSLMEFASWVSYGGLTQDGLMNWALLQFTIHRKPLQSKTRRIRSGTGWDSCVMSGRVLLRREETSFIAAEAFRGSSKTRKKD